MSEPHPDPNPDADADRPDPAAPTAPNAPALTEDQLSGALFVRWNLGALVIGLVLFGAGLAALWNGWAPGWRDHTAEARQDEPTPSAPAGDRAQ